MLEIGHKVNQQYYFIFQSEIILTVFIVTGEHKSDPVSKY